MTPLRQFKGVPAEVIRKAEGKQLPWYRYFDLVRIASLLAISLVYANILITDP